MNVSDEAKQVRRCVHEQRAVTPLIKMPSRSVFSIEALSVLGIEPVHQHRQRCSVSLKAQVRMVGH